MLGHKDAVRLLRIAKEKNIKLVFVGDPMQHGSVPRGAFMHVLKDIRLHQALPPHRNPAAGGPANTGRRPQLLSGRQDAGRIQCARRHGLGQGNGRRDERYRHMAADYLQAVGEGKSCLVVSSDAQGSGGHHARRSATQLREAGKLGDKDHEFTRLVAVDASEAERGLATTYRPGDVIQFHQNAKGGFIKGERLTGDRCVPVPVSEAAKFSRLPAGERSPSPWTTKSGSPAR